MRRFLPGAAVLALLVYTACNRTPDEAPDRDSTRAVGTSGLIEADGAIHELDTITGMNDAHAFVGRRVELHVPIQRHLNDVAFWIGSADNRVLVLLARDTRDGATRQQGEPSGHGLDAEYEGAMATISGTVQTLPNAEAMHSWALTDADRKELLDRRIYVRADSVTPHFSATTTATRPRDTTTR